MIKDVWDLSIEQDISFTTAIGDLLLVGMQYRAPMLHTLKQQVEADYSVEGNLNAEQCDQVLSLLPKCVVLTWVKFGSENGLTRESLEKLLRFSSPGSEEF